MLAGHAGKLWGCGGGALVGSSLLLVHHPTSCVRRVVGRRVGSERTLALQRLSKTHQAGEVCTLLAWGPIPLKNTIKILKRVVNI